MNAELIRRLNLHAADCLAAPAAQQPPLAHTQSPTMESAAMREIVALYPDIRGLMDGFMTDKDWNQEWDKSVRDRLIAWGMKYLDPYAAQQPLGAMNWGRLPTMADYDPAPDAARQGLTPSVTMTVGAQQPVADAPLLHCPYCSDAPLPAFEDSRVQIVYDLLNDTKTPDTGEHWEGVVARHIVAALGVADGRADALPPREPTPEMRNAGLSAYLNTPIPNAMVIWHAMYDAYLAQVQQRAGDAAVSVPAESGSGA